MAESLLVRKAGGGLKVENGVEKNYEVANGVTITKNTFVDLTVLPNVSFFQDSLITGVTANAITTCRLSNHEYLIVYSNVNSLFAVVSTYTSSTQKTRGTPTLIGIDTTSSKRFVNAVAINKNLVIVFYINGSTSQFALLEINNRVITLKTTKAATTVQPITTASSHRTAMAYSNGKVAFFWTNSSNNLLGLLIHSISNTNFTIGSVSSFTTGNCYFPTVIVTSPNTMILANSHTSSGVQARYINTSGTLLELVSGTSLQTLVNDGAAGCALVPMSQSSAMLLLALPSNSGRLGIVTFGWEGTTAWNTSSLTFLVPNSLTSCEQLSAEVLTQEYYPQTTDTTPYYNNYENPQILLTFRVGFNVYTMRFQRRTDNTQSFIPGLRIVSSQSLFVTTTNIYAYYESFKAAYINEGTVELAFANTHTSYSDFYFTLQKRIKPYSNEVGKKPFGIALENGTAGQTIKVLTTD